MTLAERATTTTDVCDPVLWGDIGAAAGRAVHMDDPNLRDAVLATSVLIQRARRTQARIHRVMPALLCHWIVSRGFNDELIVSLRDETRRLLASVPA